MSGGSGVMVVVTGGMGATEPCSNKEGLVMSLLNEGGQPLGTRGRMEGMSQGWEKIRLSKESL